MRGTIDKDVERQFHMTEIEKRVSSATSSADAFRHMQSAKEPLLVLSFVAGSIEGDLWFNEGRKLFFAKSDGDGDNPLMAIMTLLAAKNATYKLDRKPPASRRGNVDIDITLMDLAERQPKVVQRIKDILWPVQEIESDISTDATQQALPPSMYQDLVNEAMFGAPTEPAEEEKPEEVPQLISAEELESYSLIETPTEPEPEPEPVAEEPLPEPEPVVTEAPLPDAAPVGATAEDAFPDAAPVGATAEDALPDALPDAAPVGATAEHALPDAAPVGATAEDALPDAAPVGATAERLGGGDAEGGDDPRPLNPEPLLEEDMRPDDEVSFKPEEQSLFQPPEEVFQQPPEPTPEPIALRDLPEPPPVAEIIARDLVVEPESEPRPQPMPDFQAAPPQYSQAPAEEDMEQSIEEQSSRLPGGVASQRIFHQVIAASIEAGNTPSFLDSSANAQRLPAPEPEAPPATPPLNQSGRFQAPAPSAASPFKAYTKRIPIGAITTTVAAVAIVCAIGFSAVNGITTGAAASKDDTAAAVQFADDTLRDKALPK